jgi:hypothetical protein
MGPYSYQITRQGDRSIYEVTDGARKISEPILWAFGLGNAGQTYAFQHKGSYYQSRVSFYKDTQNLDITLGSPTSVPTSLEDALGAVITGEEVRLCFGCHAMGAVSGNNLHVERLIPGITCEGCHGPGGKHIVAVHSGKAQEAQIFNPGSLSTGDLLDFCGACHRTWEQVQLMHLTGVRSVRFQPYRLASSRCYDPDDNRISCLACHDSHNTVNRTPTFYDEKCTACHPTSAMKGANSGNLQQGVAPLCKVGKSQCVTCHMPKYSLPGAHFSFTDHDIRIVREGEPYPN